MLNNFFHKKTRVGFFLKITTFGLVLFSLGYFATIFSLDFNFFKRDFQNKYTQVKGVSIVAVVAGDPEKPVIQAEGGCNNAVPFVDLSWYQDTLAASFDMFRNGELLATGLLNSEYRDDLVVAGTYQYVVIANGKNGTNISSDSTTVVVNQCLVPAPEDEEEESDPVCKIKTVDGVSIKDIFGVFKTKNQKPIFTGHTNMEKAKIKIEIIGETGIFAEIKANKNGFWRWQVPLNLAIGSYEMRVRAIDPEDSTRHKSDTFVFGVIGETEKESKKTIYQKGLPFDFEMEVQNQDKVVYAGEDLNLQTIITKIFDFDSQASFIKYEITDLDGNNLIEISDPINIFGDQTIQKKINLSKLLKTGKYKIIAKTSYKNFNIFSEDEFFLKEKPIICLSSGLTITLTDILSGLGWLILLLFLLFLIFFLLLILEHHLTNNAKTQITEEILEKKGFLGKRREVDE